jgi:hypothetical protein
MSDVVPVTDSTRTVHQVKKLSHASRGSSEDDSAAVGTWCRYRGDKQANDVGVTVGEQQSSFQHWCRLWDIYTNKQLNTTFKALMLQCGLRVRHLSIGCQARGCQGHACGELEYVSL